MRHESVQAYGAEHPQKAQHAKSTDFCISPADELTPLHNNSTMPDKATKSKNRVLVKKTHIALVGGNCDLAAFQLTPPLGRSIAPVDGLFTTRWNEQVQSVQKRVMHRKSALVNWVVLCRKPRWLVIRER